MSSAIVVAGADASNSHFGQVGLSAFDKEVGRTTGLIHLLDPTEVPGYVVNGTSAKAFKDRVRGRPLRSSPTNQPITATEDGVANNKTLFDTFAISECDLSAQDATYTAGMTFVTLARPVTASINGSKNSFLLRALSGSTGRLAFYVTSGTPTLLLKDETLNEGVAWSFGGALVAGVPAVLGFRINADTNLYEIFCNDGGIAVASDDLSDVAAYPDARFTFFGAKIATGAWKGRNGKTAIWNRALSDAEMVRVFDAYRDEYAVMV